ncbi:MAG: transporter [Pseudomonadota bacterium]
MKTLKETACLALMALSPLLAVADEPAFSAGRPGNTESPLAVPKGYFQVETGIASYTYDNSDGVRTRAWDLAHTALRYGIAKDTDVQLVIQPYTQQSTHGAYHDQTFQGFGSTTFRVLHTFMGADGSSPAFGLIGFATFPTASKELTDNGILSDRTEGGVIATGSMSLNDKTSVTLTLGEAARHAGNNNYISDLSGGVNLTYAFTEKLGAYVEGFADHVGYQPTTATLDLGATYLLDRVTQLDAGVNMGLNHDTSDANFFVGWSHRF